MRKTSLLPLAIGLAFFSLNAHAERIPSELTWNGPTLPESWSPDQAPLTRQVSVGLYVDAGAWDVGREHLKLFLRESKISYRSLRAPDFNKPLQGFDVLIMPGGESWTYLERLGSTGAEHVRRFVSEGGGYIGICAGAFFATSFREGGYATGAYGIGILDGVAVDGTALKIKPFIEGMMTILFELPGFKSSYRMAMLGGPSFRFTKETSTNQEIQTIARFEEILEPTQILGRYGLGRFFLSGPHLEIEEPRLNWGEKWTDPESDWPILLEVMKRVRPRNE